MELQKLNAFVSEKFKGFFYGDEPYPVHNAEIRALARQFGYSEEEYPEIHGAIEMHDLFEDIPKTPAEREALLNEVRSLGVPEQWIQIALYVTDATGPNRQARKAETLPKLAGHRKGILVKLLDRLANVKRGQKNAMYAKEQEELEQRLRNPIFHPEAEPIWEELNQILQPLRPMPKAEWRWLRRSYRLQTELATLKGKAIPHPNAWLRAHNASVGPEQKQELLSIYQAANTQM